MAEPVTLQIPDPAPAQEDQEPHHDHQHHQHHHPHHRHHRHHREPGQQQRHQHRHSGRGTHMVPADVALDVAGPENSFLFLRDRASSATDEVLAGRQAHEVHAGEHDDGDEPCLPVIVSGMPAEGAAEETKAAAPLGAGAGPRAHGKGDGNVGGGQTGAAGGRRRDRRRDRRVRDLDRGIPGPGVLGRLRSFSEDPREARVTDDTLMPEASTVLEATASPAVMSPAVPTTRGHEPTPVRVGPRIQEMKLEDPDAGASAAAVAVATGGADGGVDAATTVAEHMGQEVEEGNIEYKWRLVDVPPERLDHLVTQMKWRLKEGQGEAFYQIGVEDNGNPKGLTEDDMAGTLKTLQQMADALQAIMTVVRIRAGTTTGTKVATVMVRKASKSAHVEIRVAVMGNVDSGKSTLIGVLTTGGLDNGRGLKRLEVFRHPHEIDNGRTSSIAQRVIGFNAKGQIVNYAAFHPASAAEIVEQSVKLVSLVDLAGHEKYLKTTMFGMTGNVPDYTMLVVGANMGVQRMTREHLGIAVALEIPTFIVITKVDLAPHHVFRDTIRTLKQILKSRSVGKTTMNVKTDDDAAAAAELMPTGRVVPVFVVSNVTGDRLDVLRKFLNLLPRCRTWETLKDQPTQFCIDDTFQVAGAGTVVGGTIFSGTVHTGQTLLLGPDGVGEFTPVVVKSVHSKSVPADHVVAGQSASLAIKLVPNKHDKHKRKHIRKGMVLVDPSLKPSGCMEFEAEVLILHHPSTIQAGYQPIIHARTVRQSACVTHITRDCLRSGDRAVVRFRFMYHTEYMTIGTPVLFREGQTKGIGRIVAVGVEGMAFPTVEPRQPTPWPLSSSSSSDAWESSTTPSEAFGFAAGGAPEGGSGAAAGGNAAAAPDSAADGSHTQSVATASIPGPAQLTLIASMDSCW